MDPTPTTTPRMFDCTPLQARLTATGCGTNQRQARQAANVVLNWGNSPKLSSVIPMLSECQLSRLTACAKCGRCKGQGTLQEACSRLMDLTRSGLKRFNGRSLEPLTIEQRRQAKRAQAARSRERMREKYWEKKRAAQAAAIMG